ncbi:hypothetical protein ACIQY5_20025 [Peribacillus frigoritolerans]|jgi:hypothetical protein|uniref:hypothetical protein n=1 Tax=Peribacillus frigoritolerans TaxID=450367 RepID=UPI0038165006
MTKDENGAYIERCIKLFDYIYQHKDKIENRLLSLLYNNLALGLKRIGEQQHAIYLYNGALEVLSFENEERKYVITGNLIVTYIQCEDWGNAKRIIDLVNENELYSLSRDHFFTTKKKSNRNLSRESIGK